MLVIILFFLAGILCVQQLVALPAMEWLLVILTVATFLGWRKYWRLTAFSLGVFWVILHASIRLEERLPEGLAGQDSVVQGYVADLPEVNPDHVRFNFKVTASSPNFPGLVRLTWYHPKQLLKAGQGWQFTVRLKPPHGNLNPGGFDYERWLFVEGIGATGYVRTQSPPDQLTVKPSLALTLLNWRQLLADRIEGLHLASANLGMIKALTIGDGNSLNQRQWDVFRRTGTTHLMVISGSHVALVAGFIYLLTLKLCSRIRTLIWSPQKLASLGAVFGAFFYAGLTGFAVPAQRAAIMLTVAMLAIVQQRNLKPFHTLGIALFAVLLIDPAIVLSAGFWLSFLAVGLIIYTLSGRLVMPGFLLSSFKINWVTSLGLAPLLLYFFQQVSLIAPLANLIAVPVIGLLIVPLALFAVLVLLAAPLFGEYLFKVIAQCLQGLWWVLVKFSELPAATFTQIQPSSWALAFAVPAILILLAPKGMPSRWLGLILLLPILSSKSDTPKHGEIKFTLLDVGQGLSAVVQTASHVLVYDAGAKFSETSNAGQSIVIPFLRSQGVNSLDALVVSHGDNDHIGGAHSVLAEYKPRQIYTSVPTLLSVFSPERCQAGQSWQWDGVRFAFLSPKSGEFSSDNDNSCVLHVQGHDFSLLLTGDIEGETETWLVKNYAEKLNSDVLIAPHHGSKTSSTFTFLQAVNPKLILIPSGYRNQFGHPHEEVLRRYKEFHVQSLISANSGALSVFSAPNLQIESWRKNQGRYWNHRP